ncbi:type II toxin-antitoxin system YafO family toxin [Pseudomonas luteola]|uniref:type II toxin-antitoxin system YafO family toxin n=1 Tax=Pseudomonas luteola TaxID=47886 RepID=UPI003A857016
MSDIEVEFHEETYRELFQEVLKDYPGLADQIKRDFTRYIATGIPAEYFGKVDLYLQPPLAYDARLWHMHLAIAPFKFPLNRPQQDRKCRLGDPGNDAALVYVQGLLEENKYRLLAIFYPDAHAKAKQHKIMSYLARLAKDFRDNN